MSDQSAPNPANPSYVDSYTPPSTNPTDSGSPAPAIPPVPPAPSVSPVPPAEPAPVQPVAPVEPVTPVRPVMPTPPATEPMSKPPAAVTPSATPAAQSQALEDQNIFTLLGVDDATEAEKEAFLDELQQVIWEDFLENDVELLLTEAEAAELKKITEGKDNNDLEQQEKIVTYLEKLVPDLEEIMLEKALELKADMVKERITSQREFFAGQTDKLVVLDQAESQIAEDQWRTAAATLNGLS